MQKLKDFLCDLPFIRDQVDAKPKVAVLRMAGIIADFSQVRRAGINFEKFKKPVEKAFATPGLSAVALVINSPGGAPAQCALISDYIRALSTEKDIPVYAFVEDVAASGGYWLSCIGEEIYAQSTSIVGSIGVISAGFGFDDFIKRHDIKRRVYTSGRDKSFLDPFKPENAEDVARLKTIQRAMHEDFKAWVTSRRGDRLAGDEAALMEGAFWTGRQAADFGLIDGIGMLEAVMKDKLGEETRFIDIAVEKKSLLSMLPIVGDAKADILIDALEGMDAKTYWSRYGL